MDCKKLNYGILGAGNIAEQKHLMSYSSIDNIDIVAICDENRDKAVALAEKYRIPYVYSDYKEMMSKHSFDIVSVCTPNFLHFPMVSYALKKGVNVHCEKPLAANVKEAEDLVRIKNESGKKLMVALNNRFLNPINYLKNYIQQGNLGDIYYMRSVWRRRRRIPGRGTWFTDKSLAGGGPLIDLGVHYLDLVLYLSNIFEPTSVSASVYSKFKENNCKEYNAYGIRRDGKFDVEDLAVGFVKFKREVSLSFEFSWASNIEKEQKYFEILGTDAGVYYENGQIKIFSEINNVIVDIYPDTGYKSEDINEFDHFVNCVINNIEPISPPEEAVNVMKIIDAAYTSAELNREIKFDT